MFLDPEIEIHNPHLPRGRFRFVLFDFDGTLSLIREGWHQIMLPMMVDVLRQTGTKESEEELYRAVDDFVMHLTGKQTIYQMIQLADEVRKRGGTPLDPLAYKHCYNDLLMARVQSRHDALASGAAKPEDWTVPGSHALLDGLRRRGLGLFLASGTDLDYVRQEADLLHMTGYFAPHIYGALDDYKSFSKKMIVEKIILENDLHGHELLGFGDGYVEIEEIKKAGGVAVAVASEEEKRHGINAWKRERLLRAGADIVIPEYRKHEVLLRFLFDD